MDFKIKEAAKYLNITEFGIRSIIYRSKTIPFYKHGKNVFIKKEDLDMYLNRIVKRNVFRRYSKDIVNEWFKLYKKGHSFKQISILYNCDQSTVSKKLKQEFKDFEFDIYLFKLSEVEKEEYRKAVDFYYSSYNISIEKVVKKFPIVTKSKFRSYLKRTGEKLKQIGIIRSNCQHHDFFENIDSEIKSYLLGFFVADGHLQISKNSYSIKIGVKINDSHILNLYNKFLCDEKASILICNNRMAVLSIGSKQLGESLVKLGFDNRKTYTFKKLPFIEKRLMRHFIRGIFDGDGSISLNRRIANKRLNGYNKQFNIANCNKELLEDIANHLPIKNWKIIKTSEKNKKIIIDGRESKSTVETYQLRVSSTEDLISLYNYFYEDSNYYFKRKKDIFYLSMFETTIINGLLQGNL